MKHLFTWILVLHAITAIGQRFDFIDNKLTPNSDVVYMKPVILFNQDAYAPSDTVFFRMFILTEDTTRLSKTTLYSLDLFNSSKELILHEMVLAGPAGTYNQFVLPKNLSHGTYSLHAYSGKSLLTNTSIFPIQVSTNVEPQPDTLEMFAEGGTILRNSLSRIVVKSFSRRHSEVVLHDELGEVTKSFINSDGWGSILFLPLADRNYYLRDHNGKNFTLPKIENNGSSLRLFQLNKGLKVVEVNSTAPENLNLMVFDQRKVVFQKELEFVRGKSQVVFEERFFPQGYSHLVVANQRQEVVAQRPVYVRLKSNLKIDLDCPTVAGQRKNIKCVIRVIDSDNNPVESVLAVSVFRKTNSDRPPQLTDPSLVLSPFQNLVTSGDSESITNELIAQSAARVFNGQKKADKVAAPVASVSLKGRLISPANLKTDSTILYFFFQKSLDRYQTLVNPDGTFEFSHALFEDDYLYYRIEKNGKELKNANVLWENESTIKDKDSNKQDQITIDSKISNSYAYFLRPNEVEKTKAALNPNKEIEDEFGGTDITINPDEYTAFETMEDLFREVVPNLLFRKNSRDSLFRVYLETQFSPHPVRFSDGNPLFVVDGWMTNNTAEIMKLNANSIAYVKLINETGKLYGIGPAARNGIVIIQTKSPDQSFKKFGQQLLRVKGIPSGLHHVYVPPKSNRHPSFETNLYWEPAVFTKADGTYSFSFFSSDMIGEFTLMVSGISRSGEFILKEKSIQVEFEPIDK